jgi:hypothetical protein
MIVWYLATFWYPLLEAMRTDWRDEVLELGREILSFKDTLPMALRVPFAV